MISSAVTSRTGRERAETAAEIYGSIRLAFVYSIFRRRWVISSDDLIVFFCNIALDNCARSSLGWPVRRRIASCRKSMAIFHHGSGFGINECMYIRPDINSDAVFVFVPLSPELASRNGVGLPEGSLFGGVREHMRLVNILKRFVSSFRVSDDVEFSLRFIIDSRLNFPAECISLGGGTQTFPKFDSWLTPNIRDERSQILARETLFRVSQSNLVPFWVSYSCIIYAIRSLWLSLIFNGTHSFLFATSEWECLCESLIHRDPDAHARV